MSLVYLVYLDTMNPRLDAMKATLPLLPSLKIYTKMCDKEKKQYRQSDIRNNYVRLLLTKLSKKNR